MSCSHLIKSLAKQNFLRVLRNYYFHMKNNSQEPFALVNLWIMLTSPTSNILIQNYGFDTSYPGSCSTLLCLVEIKVSRNSLKIFSCCSRFSIMNFLSFLWSLWNPSRATAGQMRVWSLENARPFTSESRLHEKWRKSFSSLSFCHPFSYRCYFLPELSR